MCRAADDLGRRGTRGSDSRRPTREGQRRRASTSAILPLRPPPCSNLRAIPHPDFQANCTTMAFSARRSTADVVPGSSQNDDFSDGIDDDLSVVSQSPYFTQPTQIVERPALKPRPQPEIASSPRSIIEVPASSPFRPQSAARNAPRIASFMAPAGTTFRPPRRVVTCEISDTGRGSKRPVEVIMISDDELDTPIYHKDSSDDERPKRNDIRPSSFRPKELKPGPSSLVSARTKPTALKPVSRFVYGAAAV